VDDDRADSGLYSTAAGRHLLRGVARIPAQRPAEPAVPVGAGSQEAQLSTGTVHGRSVDGDRGGGRQEGRGRAEPGQRRRG